MTEKDILLPLSEEPIDESYTERILCRRNESCRSNSAELGRNQDQNNFTNTNTNSNSNGIGKNY